MKTPNGQNFTKMTFTNKGQNGSRLKVKSVVDELKKYGHEIKETGAASVKQFKEAGCYEIPGFQLRYIYLIDKTCKITVPILPFSKIDEMGAGMYKGKKVSLEERKQHAAVAQGSAPGFQPGDGVRNDPAALIQPQKSD